MKTKISKIYIALFLLFLYIVLSCAPHPRYTSVREPENAQRPYNEAEFENLSILKTEYGIASYYGEKYHGRTTASGEVFDMNKVSAAHREHPFGTIARITNLKNNRKIVLRINDRGPFIEGRIIDLSYAAAKELDFIKEGIIEVKIEILKWGDKK